MDEWYSIRGFNDPMRQFVSSGWSGRVFRLLHLPDNRVVAFAFEILVLLSIRHRHVVYAFDEFRLPHDGVGQRFA